MKEVYEAIKYHRVDEENLKKKATLYLMNFSLIFLKFAQAVMKIVA